MQYLLFGNRLKRKLRSFTPGGHAGIDVPSVVRDIDAVSDRIEGIWFFFKRVTNSKMKSDYLFEEIAETIRENSILFEEADKVLTKFEKNEE